MLGLSDRLISILHQFDSSLCLDKINIICTESSHSLTFSTPTVLPDVVVKNGFVSRPLSSQELSVFKKHYLALSEISNSHSNSNLIFEDDVRFSSRQKFNVFWNRLLSANLPLDYDLIFFGTGCHLPTLKEGIVVPNHTWHKTKCADSYLVKPTAAKSIIDDYKRVPPFMPYDWDLSFRIDRLNLRVAWIQPGITIQGSQTGLFKSSIQ